MFAKPGYDPKGSALANVKQSRPCGVKNFFTLEWISACFAVPACGSTSQEEVSARQLNGHTLTKEKGWTVVRIDGRFVNCLDNTFQCSESNSGLSPRSVSPDMLGLTLKVCTSQ